MGLAESSKVSSITGNCQCTKISPIVTFRQDEAFPVQAAANPPRVSPGFLWATVLARDFLSIDKKAKEGHRTRKSRFESVDTRPSSRRLGRPKREGQGGFRSELGRIRKECMG